MNNKSETPIYTLSFGDIISWLFGILVLVIGLVNTFWGNDPGYGIFIFLIAFIYFPPATALFRKLSGISVPALVKIILGLFVLWSALGVAELPDKINLMMMDLRAIGTTI